MRFTAKQYDDAIEALKSAKKQLIEGTQDEGCEVCGGNCHPDYCGFNPLYAQYLCNLMAEQSHQLHDTLHRMGGFETYMGEQVGIARIVFLGDDLTNNQE